MSKDIYRNKKDFAHEEFATEQHVHPVGDPHPREVRSQKVQLDASGREVKGKKIKMSDKLN